MSLLRVALTRTLLLTFLGGFLPLLARGEVYLWNPSDRVLRLEQTAPDLEGTVPFTLAAGEGRLLRGPDDPECTEVEYRLESIGDNGGALGIVTHHISRRSGRGTLSFEPSPEPAGQGFVFPFRAFSTHTVYRFSTEYDPDGGALEVVPVEAIPREVTGEIPFLAASRTLPVQAPAPVIPMDTGVDATPVVPLQGGTFTSAGAGATDYAKQLDKPSKAKARQAAEPYDRDGDRAICRTCGRSVEWRGRYRHAATHSEARPYRCPEPGCSNPGFKQPANLETHIRKVHAPGRPVKDDYTEAQVQRCLERVSQLKRQRAQEGLRNHEAPEACPLCGKTFQLFTGLETHVPTHSKARPFRCPGEASCRYLGGKSKVHLKKHMDKCGYWRLAARSAYPPGAPAPKAEPEEDGGQSSESTSAMALPPWQPTAGYFSSLLLPPHPDPVEQASARLDPMEMGG